MKKTGEKSLKTFKATRSHIETSGIWKASDTDNNGSKKTIEPRHSKFEGKWFHLESASLSIKREARTKTFSDKQGLQKTWPPSPLSGSYVGRRLPPEEGKNPRKKTQWYSGCRSCSGEGDGKFKQESGCCFQRTVWQQLEAGGGSAGHSEK